MVLTPTKFVDIIPRSWDCRQPGMDGLPGASTMLNMTLADLSLKEAFKVAARTFSISGPPYPLKTFLHGRMVIGKGKSWRSAVVITQVSTLVSTFKLMLWCSLILTLA